MDAFVFHLCAILMLISAAVVVTRKNPVYSAIWLVFFFTQIAVCFLVLRSPFLAVIQILVYGGAIMVLFLFVLMLLNLSPEELAETVSKKRKIIAATGSLALFLGLVLTIRHSPTINPDLGEGVAPVDLTAPLAEDLGVAVTQAGEIKQIGFTLFQEHVLAFELTSIIIFIAIIGAIFLTKTRRAGGNVKKTDWKGATPAAETVAPETVAPETVKEVG